MTRNRRRSAWFVLAIIVSLCAGSAQAADLTPKLAPEKVVEEAFARMKSGQWRAAAEAFDPEALARFRKLLGPLLNAAAKAAEQKDGDKSVEVMTANVLFAPAKTVDEIRALSDREIFARVMSNTLSLAGASLERQQIIGSVAEGKDLVHVVVRNTAEVDKIAITKIEAITLHHTVQGWRLVLTGELEGLAETLPGNSGPEEDAVTPSSEPADSGSVAR